MKEDKMVLIFVVWAVAVCISTCVFLHNPTPFTLNAMEVALLSCPAIVAICILFAVVGKEF